jgi:hypothetical protein
MAPKPYQPPTPEQRKEWGRGIGDFIRKERELGKHGAEHLRDKIPRNISNVAGHMPPPGGKHLMNRVRDLSLVKQA